MTENPRLKKESDILYIMEADWIGGKDRLISHVVALDGIRVHYLNTSFHRRAAPFSRDPHTIKEKELRRVLPLVETGRFRAVAGDCIDVMLLKRFCRKLGAPGLPALMVTMDPRFIVYEEIGEQVAEGGGNPARAAATAADVFWLAGCREFMKYYTDYGISPSRLSYLPVGTFVQCVMNPKISGYLAKRAKKPKSSFAGLVEGRVLAAGNFNRDYLPFVEACAGLREEVFIIMDRKLVMRYIGQKNAGKLEDALARAKNVTVLERLPLDVYIDCLRHAGVVVVPLLNDLQITGNLTIADAQRLAKPVIAADYAAARDFILHGRTGLLYEPGSADSLRECLVSVLDDGDFARKLGSAAMRAERKLSENARAAFLGTVRRAMMAGREKR